MRPSGLAPAVGAFLALAACAADPPVAETATRAQRIQALPRVNLDIAMTAFRKVCEASAPGFADVEARWRGLRNGQAFIFDSAPGKSPFCAITARDSDPDAVWRMLVLRYGQPRYLGDSQFVFHRDRQWPLVYQVNCEARTCPERGTYQLAILPGREL